MSHKRAKRIRADILPDRKLMEGTSRGRFVRMLTQYTRRVHRRIEKPWPLQQLFGPLVFDYYTQTLDPECPRGVIKKVTRFVNEQR